MKMAPKSLPWRDWFTHAVLTLRMRPRDFWRLSIEEWRWLAAREGAQTQDALTLKDLLNLQKQYPDQKNG